MNPFLIEFTKPVIFRDNTGTIVKEYAVGERVTATAKSEHYYVTGMGGIYFHEAKEVSE